MQKDKVRVYSLARELNMESKDLLDICRQAGFDVKNQLSSLDPEQCEVVKQMIKKGGGKGGVAVAAPPKPVTVLPTDLSARVRVLDSRPRAREEPARPAATAPAATATPPAPAPPAVAPPPSAAPPAPARPETPAARPTPPAPAAAGPRPTPAPPPAPPQPAAEARPAPPPATGAPPPVAAEASKVRNLDQGRGEAPRPRRQREIPRPSFTHRIAPPPPLKPSLLKPEEQKLKEGPRQKPIGKIPDAIKPGTSPQKLIEQIVTQEKYVAPTDIDEEEGEAKGKGKRPGSVVGRDQRHAKRSQRQKARHAAVDSRVLTAEDEDRPMVRTLKHRLKQQRRPITVPRKGKVPIELPITVRSLSEAIGVRAGDLLLRLQPLLAPRLININSTLEPDMAEAVAVDFGCELDIKKPLDAEEQLLAELEQPDAPSDLVPRAPIVTIMGHVDHGKTSLLDRIRKSNVVATEAGGITQVLRAWRVEHAGKPITFLDTPGHEAFTKMRARGAQVTDIAVIVVAADDGVMPQTEEAINHAKAANVWMVVAINKVDLPNANVNRTRQQLYGLGVLPDNMGGDIPFVETSAQTGKGIDDLLEAISTVAELKELKANPKKPARGVCLEAMLSEGEGVRATLLVQNGTLHKGDAIICGSTYGRVRAMYDDQGRHIDQAGPSVPVRITGLDEVPDADDPFQVVPDLSLARSIAEKRAARKLEKTLTKRTPLSLEQLSQAKIAELKVILKADFRGSIEAIRKELDKLQHEEVRVRVLHTGIGAISESDVQLALTSPQDTIIVGFNVVPDDRARALAEEKGIQIREYDIIYKLTDDIRAALEGKLKPREEVVHLGRAVVRQTFKISRVGTIAGCFVTQGTIERNAKVRVIRNGVVVYPPADRSVGLESLKRHKDDVREVREGFECGLKIAGYDDVKVDDVIEAYRIEQVQRTL